MIEIYQDQDLLGTNRQEKRLFALLTVLSVLFIAGIAATLYYRIEWATILVTALWLCVVIFLWDLKVRPLWRYRRFVTELLQGVQRESEGVVVLLEQDTSLRDGVEFYRMLINVDPQMDPEGERQFFFDANKPRPELTAGQRVRLVYHGNDVRTYQVTADAPPPEPAPDPAESPAPEEA